jgi:hypothetical protein
MYWKALNGPTITCLRYSTMTSLNRGRCMTCNLWPRRRVSALVAVFAASVTQQCGAIAAIAARGKEIVGRVIPVHVS